MTRFQVAVLLLLMFLLRPTVADEQLGAFAIFDDAPEAILLFGEITPNSPLDFRRALSMRPDATLLILGSPGGLVPSALIIADDVHQRGMSTAIPEGFECYSACSFVFFAGRERFVEGKLGVHQMASDEPDPEGVQYTTADLLEALERYDVPIGVIARMLRTPPEDMYVFSMSEVASLGINRLATAADPEAATPSPPAIPSPPAQTVKLALYSGLDFYGADVFKDRVDSAVQCAEACYGHRQCVVFTFNANPNLSTGPNCFLKSGIDRLEAYEQAFSGYFFAEGNAPTFDVGAIDPTDDVERNRTALGQILKTISVSDPGRCRMECVDANACRAFSYVPQTRQCKLLSSFTGYRVMNGVLSGMKRSMSFAPIDVLDLSSESSPP